jgi:predicted small secreted protein
MMKTILVTTLALATGLTLAGCNTPQGQNAGAGAVLGGATGAAIGAIASGGRPGATIVGGVIGAAAGAMVGSASTPPGPGPYYQGRCAEWVYDAYGRRYCQAFY